MSESISVILADDHALLRTTLADWLRSAPDIRVVAAVENADKAIQAVEQVGADVVVMDIDMPGTTVFEAARQIRRMSANTKIIFLSAFFHDQYIEQALNAGAMSYLTKGEPPETVISAIRSVADGGVYFSPEVQARLIIDSDRPRLAHSGHTRVSTLTPRELEVLRYLARGHAKKEIAAIMDIGMKTVEKHTENLMSKLDIHDRVELARYAIREGLADA